MGKKSKPTPGKSWNSQAKDRKIVLKNILATVENGTGLTLKELWKAYDEETLFFIGLQHITTTKKALCSALNIPIEGACRYKRHWEDKGLLVQSANEVVCPLTKHLAHTLTTNPTEFDKIRKDPQTKLL